MVSCILLASPGRERLRDLAIRCYERQTYPHRELVIVDGSPGCIGALRNQACERAKGGLIAHWDDDDWSAPERLERQVGLLLGRDLQVTGMHSMPFFDIDSRRAFLYTNGCERFCVGTSLLYRRDWWRAHPFPAVQRAEDNAFVYACPPAARAAIGDMLMVAHCHGGNTVNKRAKATYWSPLDVGDLPPGWRNDAVESGLL